MEMPPMMAPPMGPAGPGGVPSDNPGLMADAMTKVREAVNLLQMSVPSLPVGTDIQKAVLDSIQRLSKEVPSSETIPGVQMTTLQGLARQAQQSAMLQQLSRAMGNGGGEPPVPPIQPQ